MIELLHEDGYNADMQKRIHPAKKYARMGARLRQLRQKAGRSGPWVIREMARRNPELAVQKSWLYAVETGERRPPHGKLELLCSTIGASVFMEIYETDGDEQPAMLNTAYAEHLRVLRELDEDGQQMIFRIARLWARLDRIRQQTLHSIVVAWEDAVAQAESAIEVEAG